MHALKKACSKELKKHPFQLVIYWLPLAFALVFTFAFAFAFAFDFALASARGINGLARSDDSMGIDEDLELSGPDPQPRAMLQGQGVSSPEIKQWERLMSKCLKFIVGKKQISKAGKNVFSEGWSLPQLDRSSLATVLPPSGRNAKNV